MIPVDDHTAVDSLLARARRRWLFNVVLEQAATGLAAAMAGAILLLLAGTQILDWYWPAVLFAAAFSWGAWRTIRKLPAAYTLAQRVDRRLGLDDTLSTALYFRDPRAGAEAAIVEAQRASAERAALTADARRAVPLEFPRPVYAAAALAMVAGGMLVLRYGVLRTLDLRQPLVEAMVDYLRPARVAAGKRPPRIPLGEQPLGVSLDSADRQLDPAPDSALDVSDIPQLDDSLASTEKAGNTKAPSEGGEKGEDQGESGENAESSRGDSQKSGQQDSGQKGGQEQGKQGQKGQAPENSSLLNKLKDAMANLMAKLNTPPPGGQQESQGGKSGGQKSGMQQAEKGQQAGGKPEGQGQQADSDSGQPGQPGEQAQAGQSNSNDRSSEQADSKTGAGKSDGSKEAREAAMLEAMGKISEILGRRAANVTGEVMVEVNSGKQQALKTPYSSRSAVHRDAGGEVSRDEIPLAFQHYVQQYFDEVRKAAPAAKPAAAARNRKE
jgi:hypothetical protein